MTHVFGPVPSRRLGRSLGVDLVPFKMCSYDCVYCQLGRTTELSVTPDERCDVDEVLAELEEKLRAVRPDVVTLSGSGDPTLAGKLGEVIDRIHAMSDVPVAVLTNGGLLSRPEVREALMGADIVCPSLDAGDAETFARVNRPHPDLDFEGMVRGLIQFARDFPGQLFLEVVFVKGMNDSDESVRKIAAFAGQIDPDRIHLNTVVRPPADAGIEPVSPEDLARFAKVFGDKAEVIADFRAETKTDAPLTDADVLALVARRPCTLEDIASGLGASPAEVSKIVALLVQTDKLKVERVGERAYYAPKGANDQ